MLFDGYTETEANDEYYQLLIVMFKKLGLREDRNSHLAHCFVATYKYLMNGFANVCLQDDQIAALKTT